MGARYRRTGGKIRLNGATGVTALALRPTYVCYVGEDANAPAKSGFYDSSEQRFNFPGRESLKTFDIEVWTNATVSVTVFTTYAMVNSPIVSFTSDTIDSVNTTTNVITAASHTVETGDYLSFTSSGTLPAGMSAQSYYCQKLTANTFTIHNTLADAWANTNLVDITDSGSGTHTFAAVAKSTRCRFLNLGLGGPNYDGVISITDSAGWRDRLYHSPDVVGYAFTATFTGTIHVELSGVDDEFTG